MTVGGEIPDKLYFKIGEVSELAGVEAHVLRYWESEFLVIKPKRVNKQRLYRRSDVENILKIKELLYSKGFTISGAKKILRQNKEKHERALAPQEARSLFDSLKDQLAEIQEILEK